MTFTELLTQKVFLKCFPDTGTHFNTDGTMKIKVGKVFTIVKCPLLVTLNPPWSKPESKYTEYYFKEIHKNVSSDSIRVEY